MIPKTAIITQLERIARNNKDGKLTHHEILVIAHGILNVLDDVMDIDINHINEINLFLTMMTKRAPHHAKCVMADQCLSLLRKGGEGKKPETLTPDNF
ncbi:hypothetical protein [Anabaena azotica]|uniref:hypothetical protein n=1 Tax=Anabaena azotica TaxID=197653 RepID=UPI0039A44752